MKFCSLASGSSGNCEFIEYKSTKILIDAGLSGKKIEGLLESIKRAPESIDAIFVTHEHTDHIQGLGVLAKRYGYKIFTNKSTLMGIIGKLKNFPLENVFVFENGLPFKFKDIDVFPMRTFHDCMEGASFVFRGGKKKISILTDTGYVNPDMLAGMEGSDLFFIEANHNENMLLEGSYPWATKQRILSNKGHLSNEMCADVLSKLLKKKNEKVILAHLSKDNNKPDLAEDEVVTNLMGKSFIKDIDYKIEVAKREEASLIHEVR